MYIMYKMSRPQGRIDGRVLREYDTSPPPHSSSLDNTGNLVGKFFYFQKYCEYKMKSVKYISVHLTKSNVPNRIIIINIVICECTSLRSIIYTNLIFFVILIVFTIFFSNICHYQNKKLKIKHVKLDCISYSSIYLTMVIVKT